jgi:hypothetical protein
MDYPIAATVSMKFPSTIHDRSRQLVPIVVDLTSFSKAQPTGFVATTVAGGASFRRSIADRAALHVS